jgi:ATP-grasp domain
MTPTVLLATTVDWPSAARLAGAFAALGARVEAVCPHDHPLRVSRHLKGAHAYHPLVPQSSFLAAFDVAAPDIIIPCDDRALRSVFALRGEIPDSVIERSFGCLENYPVMMERCASISIAREEGIAAPPTLAAPGESALVQAIEIVGFPAVLKVDGSWGGDGVMVVKTLDDALRAYRRLKGPPSRLRSLARAVLRHDAHFLREALLPGTAQVSVQQFIPGHPATSAVACQDGQVLASLHMDVLDWSGATGPASLMRRTDCSFMEEAAKRIARRFRLSGFIGLDFVRDSDGVAHLIEINPRATQICHLALGPRHDLPAALLGRPPRPVVTDKSQIALFPQLLAQTVPAAAFRDVPWDDQPVLQAALDSGLPGLDGAWEPVTPMPLHMP